MQVHQSDFYLNFLWLHLYVYGCKYIYFLTIKLSFQTNDL